MVIASLIINFIPYNYLPGCIDRKNGATLSIWRPSGYIIKLNEGAGFYKVDKKGYVNDDKPIADNYTLIVGSSFTQGKEVPKGYRYTDILNDRLGGNDGKIKVYNISQDGYYFPDIVKSFKSIIGEFPDAKNIVIEIANTCFSNTILLDALKQEEYDAVQNGENILSTLSIMQKLKMNIKELFPILSQIKSQINILKQKNNSNNDDSTIIDLKKYNKIIDELLMTIRNEYDGNLIVVYHPNVLINQDASISIQYSDTDTIFSAKCEENNIKFINLDDEFIEEYNKKKVIPYGFNNTSIGKGHFNKDGHLIMANKIYEVLESEE